MLATLFIQEIVILINPIPVRVLENLPLNPMLIFKNDK